jgi:hypothetical protein
MAPVQQQFEERNHRFPSSVARNIRKTRKRLTSAAAATSATPALRVEPLTAADMPGGQPTPPCASYGADAPKRRVQDHADIVARELLGDFYEHVAEHGGDRVRELINHTADVLRDEFKAVQQDTISEIRSHDE